MSAGGEEAAGWRLSLTLTRAAFEALESTLAENADAVVAETIETAHPVREAPEDRLRVTLFGAGPPAGDARPALLLALLRAAGVTPETEAACLADVRGRTVRAVEAMVRALREAERKPPRDPERRPFSSFEVEHRKLSMTRCQSASDM